MRAVYLDGANLEECILDRANLKDATLTNTNLKFVSYKDAVLIDTDFTGAKNFSIRCPEDECPEDERLGYGYGAEGAILWDTILPDGTIVDGPIIAWGFS